MGVDLAVWRSRIGSFNQHGGFGCGSIVESDLYEAGKVTLLLCILLVLLLIGGVEPNPGPEYVCLLCQSKPKFLTLGQSVLHQKSHALDKNFKFHCPCCDLFFHSYAALDLHAHYTHKDVRNIPQIETQVVACSVPLCDCKFPSFKLLCHHLKQVHQKFGVKTQCPFKLQCKSDNYFTTSTFSVHLSQKHKGWNTSYDIPNPCPMVSVENDISTDQFEFEMDYEVESNSQRPPTPPPPGCTPDEKLLQQKEDFYRNLAMTYLKLESEHLIPKSTVQVIADSLARLSEANLAIIGETVSSELKNLDLHETVQTKIKMNILASDCIFAAHHKDVAGVNLGTEALRKCYYKQHFDYITPKEINLSKDPHDPQCIYYIPPKKTLELFLKDPNVQQHVEKSFYRQSTDGVLEDYTDGSLAKRRKIEGEKCIHLNIFQDGFVPTKDLSSVASSHQLLGMYMNLGNLMPHIRSKLDCIRLIMIVPDFKNIFKKFKMKVFRRIVNDLKKLERTGVNFMGELVKVKLNFLIGDNKGQHEVGGFIQSFSNEYFCRYCPITRKEFHQTPWKTYPLRTAASYEECMESVQPDRETHMGVSSSKWKSPFNELQNFHCCDPGLCPCVSHDLFEGCINLDLGLIFKMLVKAKWFTYEELNRKIKKFKYIGGDSGNKPAPVKFDPKKPEIERTLGGHAIQNWTLLRLLPFIIEDCVDDVNNVYWKLYLQLKEMTEYICAPSITNGQVVQMKFLIKNYMSQRQNLFGVCKPKHHFIAHYPELFKIMGPLFPLSTLRFENYHQYFKRAAKMGQNFINLGVTLMKKYCMYLAYLCAGTPIFSGVLLTSNSVPFGVQKNLGLDPELEVAVQGKGISDSALIVTSAQVDDLKFKVGMWLLMGSSRDNVVVGKVLSLLYQNGTVHLVLNLSMADYDDDYGIYVVRNNHFKTICTSVMDIKYPMPQSMYEWRDNELCFSLKHTLAYDAPT